MRKMSREEEQAAWLRLNVSKLKKATEELGHVRLYQFEKEDKDAFIEAVKTLEALVEKYEENES